MALDIGSRIIELRSARGLSQEALANELGLSRQAVSRWERGEALPDTENLIALADLFGVTLDELVRPQVAPAAGSVQQSAAPAAGSKVTTPLPGTILDVFVNVGDAVKAGQTVVLLEAMKMENNIEADVAGTVKEVKVRKGDSVLEGDVLVVIG